MMARGQTAIISVCMHDGGVDLQTGEAVWCVIKFCVFSQQILDVCNWYQGLRNGLENVGNKKKKFIHTLDWRSLVSLLPEAG